MKTHPIPQTFGCFDVELRVHWLEAKGDPLSRLDTVIDWEGFRPLLVQALAKPAKGPGADRTRLRLHEPVHERILPALHWAAAQRGGDWPDQPDLQPRPLRTDRAVEAAATERRLKNEIKTKNDRKSINRERSKSKNYQQKASP
jgi:hypothetical protein